MFWFGTTIEVLQLPTQTPSPPWMGMAGGVGGVTVQCKPLGNTTWTQRYTVPGGAVIFLAPVGGFGYRAPRPEPSGHQSEAPVFAGWRDPGKGGGHEKLDQSKQIPGPPAVERSKKKLEQKRNQRYIQIRITRVLSLSLSRQMGTNNERERDVVSVPRREDVWGILGTVNPC